MKHQKRRVRLSQVGGVFTRPVSGGPQGTGKSDSRISEQKTPIIIEENASGENANESVLADSDRKVGFYTDENAQEIRWDRFKSDKNRQIVKSLLKAEALRMGMVEKAAEIAAEGFNFAEVAGIWNAMAVGMVTAVTHCPPKVSAILAFTQEEQDTINVKGAADRLCAKYIGIDFKYFDEIVVSLALAPLLYTKFAMFKHVMKQWHDSLKAQQAHPNPPPQNVTPIRPLADTADRSE